MKNLLMIYILATGLMFTSLSVSQEGIQRKRDIDNLIQKHKHPHSMKSAPWDRFQDREKRIGRHIPDLDRQDEAMPPHRFHGVERRSPSDFGKALQSKHSPSSQQDSNDSTNIAWVRNYGSGLAPTTAIATAIAADNSGNVYVTGYTTSQTSSYDYATIKYNVNGDTVWVRRYNGTGNWADEPVAIAVDETGNVYVTGSSCGVASMYDYATVKYNANGDTLWVRRYNGPGNENDYTTSLIVDSLGNVYVTGSSFGSTSETDYATIKYNAIGDIVWVRRYNGPKNSYDDPTSLAVDHTGNVYVTGQSNELETGEDYATIKYNANGDSLWVRGYNGPGNLDDKPIALAVDDAGNVYVTGYRKGTMPYLEYATMKYNPNGDLLWVRGYDGSHNGDNEPTALVVDGYGNVYVTGMSYGYSLNYDCATIKYNTNGDSMWVRRYNGPDNGDDVAASLLIDSLGNVYITGSSFGSSSGSYYLTIKYKANGDLVWVSRYHGLGYGNNVSNALAIGNSGSVYVAGKSDGSAIYDEYTTIRYKINGDTDWVRRYSAPESSSDEATSLAVDDSGNVYVTGESFNQITGDDYETIKYNTNGDTVWVRRYDGPANRNDVPIALAIDGFGNVYVTGSSIGPTSYDDYATIKYNANGDTIWVRRYDGPDHNYDEPVSLALDGAGNVYVTGGSYSSTSEADYVTIKYKSNGDTAWVRRYEGPGSSVDEPSALAIDGAGNVYVTGWSYGSSLHFDYVTIKYNTVGDLVWVRRYNGPANRDDEPVAIAVDGLGNVYVTGSSDSSTFNVGYATIKYNSNGEEVWISRFDGRNGNSEPTALAIDSSGNVYVTGKSQGARWREDYVTIKYTPNGNTVWMRSYNGPANQNDEPVALVVDRSENVYVTGNCDETTTDISGIATIKYNANGDLVWEQRYEGQATYYDNKAISLALDGSRIVYITGYCFNGNMSLYTTIKYTQTPDSVIVHPYLTPSESKLEQNYPNPFNPTTRLSFVISHTSLVTLKVYDILGKEVATLLNNKKYETGSYEVPFDASRLSSGVYFYKLEAENSANPGNSFTQVKKMVLMK